ncbi:MAG: hypothetical protein J6Q84_00745 [Kiritimatiellae bacterium]|nr:hypothetical protein [Kiritimatiellia bacterium]
MENIITLFDAAVTAIKESHETLKAKLTPIFIGYSSNILPPRPERASRILDCEANGAHKLLEDLASGAKAQPRGELEAAPDELLASCNSFLFFLQDNLKSPDCDTAINMILSTIGEFTNLIKGLSGCDPDITTKEYHKRINKYIRKLKDRFLNLGNAIIKYEFTLSERAKAAQEILTQNTTKPIEPKLISPPSRKKDELRRTAVALMKRVKKDTACTWSEAEDTVQKAMWKEFDNCGLRVSKNNFHSLRYNNNYIDEPEADDALMKEYSLLTIHESHKILTA